MKTQFSRLVLLLLMACFASASFAQTDTIAKQTLYKKYKTQERNCYILSGIAIASGGAYLYFRSENNDTGKALSLVSAVCFAVGALGTGIISTVDKHIYEDRYGTVSVLPVATGIGLAYTFK